ncbi:TolC family protein [Sulfurimonas sp.]|uniref:TolC family protein n=1 Tax=Sulfurimonas sp. TaxID=2022749 RepID=UPI00356A3590
MRNIIVILSLPAFIYAYSLNELVDIAHENRLVKSAKHSLNASEKSYDSTQSSYLPTIEIGASAQYASKESAALPQNTIKAYGNLKYTIYDGGKKSDLYNQLKSNIDAQEKNLEALKNDISLDVSRLYFEYLSLLSDKKATEQEMEQLKAELARLNMFFKSGSATKDEVLKIDSRVKNSNVSLQEIELNIQKVLHTLEYYTTKKIDTITEDSTINYLGEESQEPRADIEKLEFEASAIKHSAESVRSQNYPTLFFDDTLSHSDYTFDNKSLNMGTLIENQNIATLNISWNILDFGATTKNYEATYEQYLSQKSLLEHQKAVADVDYRLALKSLEISKVKIEATKSTLDAASSTYELIKLRYQNGIVDNIAYLQALSEKFEASRGYKRALYDHEVKKAELLYYSGKNIKEYLK